MYAKMAATAEPLVVPRPSGRPLQGILVSPDVPSSGVIVLYHGLLSDKNHNFAPQLADQIARRTNLHCFRFDFRTGPTPEEPEHRFRYCAFMEDVDDAVVVCKHLEDALKLPVRAVLGHSRGGNVAVMHVSQWRAARVPPLIAIAPRFRMVGMLGKFDPAALARVEAPDAPADAHFVWETKAGPITVTKEDVAYVRALRMEPYIQQLPKGHPMLLLHGTADITIPVEDAHAYKAAADAAGVAVELHIVDGAQHTFGRSKHSELLINLVVDFLHRHVPDCVVPGRGEGLKGVAKPASSPTGSGAGASASSPASSTAREGKAKKDGTKAKDAGGKQAGTPMGTEQPTPATVGPSPVSDAVLSSLVSLARQAEGGGPGCGTEQSSQLAALIYGLAMRES